MNRPKMTCIILGLFATAALICVGITEALEGNASNTRPLTFGTHERIIELGRVHWSPLKGERFKPGAEVAVLRGSLASGPVEFLLRFPAHYAIPMHSHSSDETFISLKGTFTY